MKARPRVPTRKTEEAVDRRQNDRSDKAMDLYVCRYRSMAKAMSSLVSPCALGLVYYAIAVSTAVRSSHNLRDREHGGGAGL